jgi:hypothetical protein
MDESLEIHSAIFKIKTPDLETKSGESVIKKTNQINLPTELIIILVAPIPFHILWSTKPLPLWNW